MGWRYVFFTIGALIFVPSVLRVTIIRLKETSKFLLSQGRDAELVKHFQGLAARYNRPCSLTLAKLEACGTISTAHKKSRWSLGVFFLHVSSLFSSTKVTITSVLLILSWMMIGLAYLCVAFLAVVAFLVSMIDECAWSCSESSDCETNR